VWTGDQARVAPDFLAVIDFDELRADPRVQKLLRQIGR